MFQKNIHLEYLIFNTLIMQSITESTNSHTLELQHSSKRQFQWYNVLMVLLMSLGSIEYGYNASIIATTLAQPSFVSYFRLDTRSNATQLIASTNGVYYGGGFIAVWTVSWLADRWGRKFAIGISAFVNLIAAAGLTGSTHIAMFIVFRFISGMGAFVSIPWSPGIEMSNLRTVSSKKVNNTDV